MRKEEKEEERIDKRNGKKEGREDQPCQMLESNLQMWAKVGSNSAQAIFT